MRTLLVLLFMGLLSGCASVIYMPTSTGQIPETSGRLSGGRAGLDVRSATGVTIINDISTNPVTRTAITVGSNDDIIGQSFGWNLFSGSNVDFNFGLLERLDIYFVQALGVRYMLFGTPGEVGWRSTAFVGGYQDGQSASATASSTKTANVSTSGMEYGLSAGYRFKENVMVYLTVADRSGRAEITVSENSVEQERYRDEYDHYIASLGALFGSAWYLKIELNASQIEWRGQDALGNAISDSATEGSFTLGGGYQW